MKKVVCSFCKKEYQKYPSQIGLINYCSRECHNKARLVHIYKCEFCKTIFHRPIGKTQKKPRFCSPKCMYTVLKVERNKPNCICLRCKKKFRRTPYALAHGEGKFCSWECKKYGSRGAESARSHYYGLTDWRETRLKILERDNYTCTKCGVKDVKLHVNHKEFRQLGGSDDPSNLETLCMPCHAKTDSDKLKELTGNDKALMRDYKNFFTK